MTPRVERMTPDCAFEEALWQSGLTWVGGIDEAGRGAWAGPVAAAVVILPARSDWRQRLPGVRDSKQMTPDQRAHWAEQIQVEAAAWAVGFASAQEIDCIGILPATRLAVSRALEQVQPVPQHLLVDFLRLPEINLPQTPLVKGDARCLSIAAASVLAKTSRDRLMCAYEERFPGYSFARHKGYGTAAHQAALAKLGPCAEHRLSFAPLKTFTAAKEISAVSEVVP